MLTVSEHDDVCGVSGGPGPQQVSRGVIHAMRQRLTADHNLTFTQTHAQTVHIHTHRHTHNHKHTHRHNQDVLDTVSGPSHARLVLHVYMHVSCVNIVCVAPSASTTLSYPNLTVD